MPSNFLYAIAPSGQVVKIAIDGKTIDRVKISEKLITSGISINDLPRIAFSLSPRRRPISYTIEERKAVAVNKVDFPPLPEPIKTGRNQYGFPEFSTINFSEGVTLKSIKDAGGGFFMKQFGDTGYIDILSIPEKEFENNTIYQNIHNGTFSLKYGKLYRRADQQSIPPNLNKYETASTYTSGISQTTGIEIEATLGYEGFGVSASLRFLFKTEFTVSEEEVQYENFTILGEPDILKVFGLYQNCEILTFWNRDQRETGFKINIVDKNGNPKYQLIDVFDGTLNPLQASEGILISKPYEP